MHSSLPCFSLPNFAQENRFWKHSFRLAKQTQDKATTMITWFFVVVVVVVCLFFVVWGVVSGVGD